MAAKVNYTAEMTERAVADYKDGVSVETIAETLGKTTRSVISKLVREGVYVAPEKPKAEPRDLGPTKAELLATLESVSGVDVEGLEAANKAAIQNLIDAFEANVSDGD